MNVDNLSMAVRPRLASNALILEADEYLNFMAANRHRKSVKIFGSAPASNFLEAMMGLTASWKTVATALAFGFLAALVLGMI